MTKGNAHRSRDRSSFAGGSEGAGGGIDTENHDGVGVLVFYEEELTRGIHREVARFLATGREFACEAKCAIRGIDGENRNGVMAAIGSVEPFAIGMHGDFRRVVAAVEVTWQRRDNLEVLECSFRRVVGKGGDGGVEFADHVEEFSV